ncbi:Lysophospholipase L1 [Anaerocolumna jejuensis DSM 15929]|uniref:Lysophospholipase L1 n=1 Tax=Anaerocolumna jejuensis DSM 15929 TaxID=1121322 RepID=A0A1M6XI82_9FIRM|nr:SGNH/GDSL hydrolase family protein [Anaerocolumna jejuensis]SHL05626.1 Lysophospholipase L1 [Anaerocolumna jejuensis DSM 15929]
MEFEHMADSGIVDFGNLHRIGKTMKKAMSGEEITVGMIGGSITQGSLSSTPKTCYAYLVYEWWVRRFPGSKVHYINAGIGGTSSHFGAARVVEDLLVHQPDFVITEFSVNDSNTPFFKETYEGLIRRILTHEAEPGVLILNNVFYKDGTNAQEMHNEVGAFYGLPMVSIKDSLYRLVEAGEILKEDITPDDLHPNDAGHKLVADIVTHMLDWIYKKVIKEEADKDYILPKETLTANRFEDSLRLNNRNSQPAAKGFEIDNAAQEKITDIFRNGWSAGRIGDTISFEVEAGNIAVQYKKTVKRQAPVATVIVDKDMDNQIVLDANFEEDWGDCLYLQNLLTGGEKKKHTLDITITQADEKSNLDFYLVSIIISDR